MAWVGEGAWAEVTQVTRINSHRSRGVHHREGSADTRVLGPGVGAGTGPRSWVRGRAERPVGGPVKSECPWGGGSVGVENRGQAPGGSGSGGLGGPGGVGIRGRLLAVRGPAVEGVRSGSESGGRLLAVRGPAVKVRVGPERYSRGPGVGSKGPWSGVQETGWSGVRGPVVRVSWGSGRRGICGAG